MIIILTGCKSGDIINIDLKQAEQKINDKNEVIIYLGSDSCPLCPSVLDDLKVVTSTAGLVVYFLDVTDYEKDAEKIYELETKLKTDLRLPLIVVYNDGEKVNTINGSQGVDYLEKELKG